MKYVFADNSLEQIRSSEFFLLDRLRATNPTPPPDCNKILGWVRQVPTPPEEPCRDRTECTPKNFPTSPAYTESETHRAPLSQHNANAQRHPSALDHPRGGTLRKVDDRCSSLKRKAGGLAAEEALPRRSSRLKTNYIKGYSAQSRAPMSAQQRGRGRGGRSRGTGGATVNDQYEATTPENQVIAGTILEELPRTTSVQAEARERNILSGPVLPPPRASYDGGRDEGSENARSQSTSPKKTRQSKSRSPTKSCSTTSNATQPKVNRASDLVYMSPPTTFHGFDVLPPPLTQPQIPALWAQRLRAACGVTEVIPRELKVNPRTC